jgi:hypothetical protein
MPAPRQKVVTPGAVEPPQHQQPQRKTPATAPPAERVR